MKCFVIILFLVAPLFATNPVARWPLDDQTGTTTIRDVIGTANGTWVGTDVVVDGDMTNSVNWTDPGTWTVAGNIATRTANAANLTLTPAVALSLTVGNRYTITFALTSTAGTLTVTSLDGNQTLATYVNGVDGDGTKTITATLTGDDLINFTADASFAGTVDTVVIREIAFSSGTGIAFDGVGDYVILPITDTFNTTHTVSMWFKANLLGGFQELITFAETDRNDERFRFVFDGTQLVMNNDYGIFMTKVGFTNDVWHHVAGTVDTAGVLSIFYVDGVQHETDSSFTDPGATPIGIAYIGVRADAGASFFDGFISDVRFYNVVLTADQVKGIFKGERRKLRARYNNKEYEPSLRSRYN